MKISISILNFGIEGLVAGVSVRITILLLESNSVGWSEVLLETKRDNMENNLGNLITGICKSGRCYLSFLCTDSMVEFNKWDDINIAFMNDGGMR